MERGKGSKHEIELEEVLYFDSVANLKIRFKSSKESLLTME